MPVTDEPGVEVVGSSEYLARGHVVGNPRLQDLVSGEHGRPQRFDHRDVVRFTADPAAADDVPSVQCGSGGRTGLHAAQPDRHPSEELNRRVAWLRVGYSKVGRARPEITAGSPSNPSRYIFGSDRWGPAKMKMESRTHERREEMHRLVGHGCLDGLFSGRPVRQASALRPFRLP